MTHSLIHADRGTHCKIVALALIGALLVVMAAVAAKLAGSDAEMARLQARATVVKAGEPAVAAALDQKAVR
jgi:hypothetical protein